MRQRLRALFPVLLFALMVQILAPVGAAWAVALAVSDPLAAAEICHSDSSSTSPDDQSHRHAHDACAFCSVAQTGASLDTPQPVALHAPYREADAVSWHDHALTLSLGRTGSHAKARAPPAAA
jgi:hypothetical protein